MHHSPTTLTVSHPVWRPGKSAAARADFEQVCCVPKIVMQHVMHTYKDNTAACNTYENAFEPIRDKRDDQQQQWLQVSNTAEYTLHSCCACRMLTIEYLGIAIHVIRQQLTWSATYKALDACRNRKPATQHWAVHALGSSHKLHNCHAEVAAL